MHSKLLEEEEQEKEEEKEEQEEEEQEEQEEQEEEEKEEKEEEGGLGGDIDSGCSADLGPLPSPGEMTSLESHQGGASTLQLLLGEERPGAALLLSPVGTQQLPLIPAQLLQGAPPPPPCPPPPLPSPLMFVVITVPHTLCFQPSM